MNLFFQQLSNTSDNLSPLECPGTLMGCYCILNVNWTFLQEEQWDNVPLTNGIRCNNVSTVILEQVRTGPLKPVFIDIVNTSVHCKCTSSTTIQWNLSNPDT